MYRPTLAVFALAVIGLSPLAAAADDQPTIRLLSDDNADRCIQNESCLNDLFQQAVLGGDGGEAVKWTEPARITSFVGEGAPPGLAALIQKTMEEAGTLARAAGADVGITDTGAGDTTNMLLLVSDDFDRDRDSTFRPLLADVFAGNTAFYDELATAETPICQSQLFAAPSGRIAGSLSLAESDVEAADLRRCINRTMLKMLGLRHPLPEGTDSVLDQGSERQDLTAIDFLLLKLLYNPAIEAGMDAAEIEAVFSKVYERMIGPSG